MVSSVKNHTSVDNHTNVRTPQRHTIAKNRTDVDAHVGLRIRQRRTMLGLTQQQLADLIGVTYQQAHKYEKGINRVSAGRLYDVAQVLGVSISYFYEGIGEEMSSVMSDQQRLCLELARNFTNIPNPKHREAVAQIVRSLAEFPTDNATDSEDLVEEKVSEELVEN